MQLSRHHTLALVTTGCLSAVALTDAVTHGLTGHFSVFSDGLENRPALAASAVVHGLAYVALAWVLLREGHRFATTNRVARATRWVVIACLGLLAAGFLLVMPFLDPRRGYEGALDDTLGVLVGPAFLGMLLGSLVLGLALLRSPVMGLGPRVLALMLPILGVTILLGWLAPAWAHPAYLEATSGFGLALLGVGAGRWAPGPAGGRPADHGVRRHHVPALLLAGVTVGALAVDTVVVAATGEPTFVTDDAQGNTATTLAGAVVLGATFAALALVVHRESARFATARRAARAARPVLLAGLAFLAVGFVTVYPAQHLAGVDSGPVADASALVALAALGAVTLASFVIGLAGLGRNALGLGGTVLAALVPVAGLTAGLAATAPDLASPVYCTAVLLTGLALLGVRSDAAGQPATREAIASPTAAV